MGLETVFAAKTDVGRRREANEDCMGHLKAEWGELYVVCDGMGGHVGGARASRLAKDSIIGFFREREKPEARAYLREAIEFANFQIFAEAQQDPGLKGMGTTCIVLLIMEDSVWVAHVGDSRAYLLEKQQLNRISRDHSFVQKLAEDGIIKEHEMETHPRKNELLRALGIREKVDVEVASKPIKPASGVTFLLCSDGLNGMISDQKIREIMLAEHRFENIPEVLVQAANDAGGFDNITAQMVRVVASPYKESTFEPFKLPSSLHSTDPNEAPAQESFLSHRPPSTKKNQSWIFIGLGVILLIAFFAISNLDSIFPDEEPSASPTTQIDGATQKKIQQLVQDLRELSTRIVEVFPPEPEDVNREGEDSLTKEQIKVLGEVFDRVDELEKGKKELDLLLNESQQKVAQKILDGLQAAKEKFEQFLYPDRDTLPISAAHWKLIMSISNLAQKISNQLS